MLQKHAQHGLMLEKQSQEIVKMTQHIILYGASGRMGQAILDICLSHPDYVDTKITPVYRNLDLLHDLSTVTHNAIIDFTCDEATCLLLSTLLELNIQMPLLIGTTALSQKTIDLVETYSHCAPVMIASNTSLIAHVQNEIAAFVTKRLRTYEDINIIETHHNQKKDSPSGTALTLKRTIENVDTLHRFVNIHSLRAGNIIGEHTLSFHGPYDSLEITHRVFSRHVFGEGALHLIQKLQHQAPGLYTVECL